MALQGLGLELAIFLFTAFVAYYVSIRIGLTAVVGEILLGIALGPSLLNIVHYGEGVQVVAELGAIFLLFVVGLEVRFSDIYTKQNFIIAAAGVAIPFASGFALAALFGYATLPALFIATALTATSIAISAYVLKDLGYLSSPAAKAIIGAAVVDDVLALLVLAVTTGVANGEFSVFSVALKCVIAGLFVIGTLLARGWVKRLLSAAQAWGEKRGHPKAILLLAIAFAFAYSWVAEFIGLSAIVGAFLAGVTMHGLKIKETKDGAQYLEMVFGAIFFVSIGILVDVRQIALGWFFFTFLVIAILNKVVACGLAAKVLRFKWRESLIIGAGMLPRGEIALVVGLIGLTGGHIDQTLYGAILAMTLITTILAPLVLGMLIAKPKSRIW